MNKLFLPITVLDRESDLIDCHKDSEHNVGAFVEMPNIFVLRHDFRNERMPCDRV